MGLGGSRFLKSMSPESGGLVARGSFLGTMTLPAGLSVVADGAGRVGACVSVYTSAVFYVRCFCMTSTVRHVVQQKAARPSFGMAIAHLHGMFCSRRCSRTSMLFHSFSSSTERKRVAVSENMSHTTRCEAQGW